MSAHDEPAAKRTAAHATPACCVCSEPPENVPVFQRVENIPYYRCSRCEATFMDPAARPTAEAARARYEKHQNNPADAGYRRFLGKVVDPLLAELSPGQHGLDYGCGPGPALVEMMNEAGHHFEAFDPIYFNNDALLSKTYDVVTCTEVAEHFDDPRAEFERLAGLLRVGGLLAVMTSFLTDDVTHKFAQWYYRRDPTHIVFYREATLRFIAEWQNLAVTFPAPNVAIFRKL